MRRIDASDRWHQRYNQEEHTDALARLLRDIDRLGPHVSHLFIHPAGQFVQTCLYCGLRFDEPSAFVPCECSPFSPNDRGQPFDLDADMERGFDREFDGESDRGRNDETGFE